MSEVTWDDVREEWSKAGQMGAQSVLQAARVGQMLIELKDSTPHGEFEQKASALALLSRHTCNNLMTLARHLPLLEQQRPESQRAALALIKAQQPPKPPRLPKPSNSLPKDQVPSSKGNFGAMLSNIFRMSDGLTEEFIKWVTCGGAIKPEPFVTRDIPMSDGYSSRVRTWEDGCENPNKDAKESEVIGYCRGISVKITVGLHTYEVTRAGDGLAMKAID